MTLNGRTVACDETGTSAWARVLDGNPLDGVRAALDHKMLGPRVVCWSGWHDDHPPARARDAALGTFPRDPRSWNAAAWTTFNEWSAAASADLAASGGRLLLRPHARHVVGDVPRCMAWLGARAAEGAGLVLDPVSMLEVSMLASAEDHLERILWALGGHGAVAAVVVVGAEVVEREDGPAARAVALAESDPIARLVARLVRAHVPAAVPRVVLGEAGRQRALVESLG